MADQEARDKRIYNLAVEFLLGIRRRGEQVITREMLGKYFTPIRPETISGIYERILESAQNANMRAGVIGGSIGGIARLDRVLCGFSPRDVLNKYQNDAQRVFREVTQSLRPRGEINPGPSGLWPRYCRTILASAAFVAQFRSAEDFYSWVNFFYEDDRTRPALPLLLHYRIYGFGMALACDFLKELGYIKFGKPDVHLRAIFTNLEMCPPAANDYELLNAIVRVAENAGVSPYTADKVFWLIGSGKFYLHPGLKVGRNRERFILYAQERL